MSPSTPHPGTLMTCEALIARHTIQTHISAPKNIQLFRTQQYSRFPVDGKLIQGHVVLRNMNGSRQGLEHDAPGRKPSEQRAPFPWRWAGTSLLCDRYTSQKLDQNRTPAQIMSLTRNLKVANNLLFDAHWHKSLALFTKPFQHVLTFNQANAIEITDFFMNGRQPNMHAFGQWENIGIPGENPHKHQENM